MAITVTLDPTFLHLNGDTSLSTKVGGVGRERTAIVNVAITATTTYATGGITVDFSKVRGFKQVYVCEILQGHGGFHPEFIPAASNAAATGKIKFYGINEAAVGGTITALDELAAADATIQGITLRCRIIGI
jgi:hypothetical protein